MVSSSKGFLRKAIAPEPCKLPCLRLCKGSYKYDRYIPPPSEQFVLKLDP